VTAGLPFGTAVLKIHVLHRGGDRYYVDDLVPGRAEGTLLAGEAPGEWWGRAAVDLGLRGTVAGPEFAELLAGRNPASSRPLRIDRLEATSGFDLTFCAPKSVSILHLLAPTEMAAEVGAGHAAAVADATGYLERAAAGVRRSRGGVQVRLAATGLATGAFLHRTSRALDPHLHTHVVVANVAQGPDGEWSSLDSRRLFRHGPAAQAVYHACLRYELSDRLGVAWSLRPSGLSDVVGVDATLCRLFSGRTADMDEHVHRQGTARPTSRQVVALVTRPPKDRSRGVEDLMGEWRARALELGFPPSELTQVIGLGRSVPSVDAPDRAEGRLRRTLLASDMGPEPDRLARRLADLSGAERSLTRRDLVAEVAAACRAGAPSAVIESVADRLSEGAPPVPPAAPPTAGTEGSAGLAGLAGSVESSRSFEPRWPAGRLSESLAHLPSSQGTVDLQPVFEPWAPDRRVSAPHTLDRLLDRVRETPDRDTGAVSADPSEPVECPVVDRDRSDGTEPWRRELRTRRALLRERSGPELGR
jgi:conjugative relaxase-like TrwC/TraI family protein